MGLPTNPEIADDLRLLGDLLELEGASRHRVLAYRRAAARLNATAAPVAQMALDGTAAELPDIGTTLQAKIAERAGTGRIAALEVARGRVPEGLVAVARLPGLGPKRAVALWQELGVQDLDTLGAAAQRGGLRSVRGLGAATERAVLEALTNAAEPAETRWPIGRALPIAEELAVDLAQTPGVLCVEVAGSLRRGAELVHDLDLVAATDDPRALAAAVGAHPAVASPPTGEERILASLHAGPRLELAACPSARFGNLLQHATGSAAHNVRLRERARALGRSVSEHGISGPDGTAQHDDEAGVYAELGLDWIPPELREDHGEIALAERGELPSLVTRADLRGDLHVHTDWSDGADPLDAMVAAATSRGLQYVAISDHSPSLAMAGGLSVERLARQRDAVQVARERHPDIEILHATEVDILADGSLDLPDEVLAGLDWVTASVHSAFRAGPRRMTERLLRAIEHPLVDAIGHPTGRMRERRPSSEMNLPRVIEAAARTGTCLEINAQPRRLDLDATAARAALAAGARLVIGSDAHSTDAFDLIRFGVLVARRAGAGAGDVANCRTWAELRDARAARLAAGPGRS